MLWSENPARSVFVFSVSIALKHLCEGVYSPSGSFEIHLGVLGSIDMKDRFIEMLKSCIDCRMVFLPSVKSLTFSFASFDAASKASLKGFIHGGN